MACYEVVYCVRVSRTDGCEEGVYYVGLKGVDPFGLLGGLAFVLDASDAASPVVFRTSMGVVGPLRDWNDWIVWVSLLESFDAGGEAILIGLGVFWSWCFVLLTGSFGHFAGGE